nr:glycosyltransferase family A protein [uncultured Draconibacterium sp.]
MKVESKNKPTVSVIVTTYRRPHFIRNSITCLLKQTQEDLEIIVVDDNGSNTKDQIKTFCEIEELIDKGVIDYHKLNTNSGACFARNYGAKLAHAKYIAFFDDDDEWDVTKLEKQYHVIKSDQNLGFVYCFQEAIDYKTGRVFFGTYDGIGKGNVYNELLKIDKRSLATPNPLIRKSAFEKIGGFDEQLKSAQDIDLFIRIAKRYKVDYVPEVLHKAIIHPSERISSKHENKVSGYTRFLKKYEQDLNLETLRYIHSRIIYHSYFINDFSSAKSSIRFLKYRNLFSVKYYLYALGLRNRFFKFLLSIGIEIRRLLKK